MTKVRNCGLLSHQLSETLSQCCCQHLRLQPHLAFALASRGADCLAYSLQSNRPSQARKSEQARPPHSSKVSQHSPQLGKHDIVVIAAHILCGNCFKNRLTRVHLLLGDAILKCTHRLYIYICVEIYTNWHSQWNRVKNKNIVHHCSPMVASA